MTISSIYRGHDIIQQATDWIVTKDGQALYTAKKEDEALNWIDKECRRLRQTQSAS